MTAVKIANQNVSQVSHVETDFRTGSVICSIGALPMPPPENGVAGFFDINILQK